MGTDFYLRLERAVGEAWRQVQTHDASADGQFVYAVETTGIFCRPSFVPVRPRRPLSTGELGLTQAEARFRVALERADQDFVIVARTDAFGAGLSVEQAIGRARTATASFALPLRHSGLSLSLRNDKDLRRIARL